MKNVILVIVAIVVLGGIIYVGSTPDNSSQVVATENTIKVVQNNIDIGIIPIRDGNVSRNFKLMNEGEDTIVVSEIYTSCMCTTVNLEVDGKNYGPFGMKGHGLSSKTNIEIPTGGEIIAKVIFDPMAHGPEGTGEIVRDVFIKSNSTQSPTVLKFKGEVVESIPQAEGPSLYFSTKEYDFGLIKQSGGVYQGQFDVINNGSENVVVNSLPTSCGCTSAKIDKKEIKPGERAVITASFDANLHIEPEGRFFKTIVVDSNIEPNPELKIFAEIDLDLGVGAYKEIEHED